MKDTDDLWKSCSEALREQVSDASWQAYLSGITPLSIKDSEIVLGVPNTLIRDRVESRFLGLIQATVTGTVGRNLVVQLEVVAPVYEPRDEAWPTWTPIPPKEGLDRRPTRSPPLLRGATPSADRPVPEGPTGSIHQCSIPATPLTPSSSPPPIVSPTPPPNRWPNPPPGPTTPSSSTGRLAWAKPTSLHAIGNYVLENFPGRHVRYVTTETYMNEFVDAIRTNTTTAFKRRYRECDVLLIDDVQFMERKESLQEEFFHTFNSLYGASKQIVLTSDRPPKSIATLEDRLRSRFMSGLITEVQPPELETRLAILQTKAEHEQVDVPDEVLEFIATHVKDNIRELEGALIRVTAFASLNRQPMSRELAEVVLSDIVSADQPRRITPKSSWTPLPRPSGSRWKSCAGPTADARWSPPARSACTYSANSPISAIRPSGGNSGSGPLRRSCMPSRRSPPS